MALPFFSYQSLVGSHQIKAHASRQLLSSNVQLITSPKLRPLEVVGRNHLRTTTSGGHSREEPPGPIPNPEVKLLCADGSGTIGPVRVGRRQL